MTMTKVITFLMALTCMFGKARAICECQMTEQKYSKSTPTFFIISPVDHNNRLCAANCNITLDSADDTKGIGNLVIVKFEPPSPNTYFTVFNDDGTKVWDPIRNEDKNTDYENIWSTSRIVHVQLITDTPVNIVATLARKDSLYQPVTISPTPTTTPSASTISSDILFALDQTLSANPDPTDALSQMKAVINGLTKGMTITSADAMAADNSKSRLGLIPLDPYGGFDATTKTWAYDSVDEFNDVVNSVQQIRSSASAIFTDSINGSLDAYFNVNPKVYVTLATRPHVERVIAILTAGVPSDIEAFASFVSSTSLSDYDVHLLILGYQLKDEDQAYYKDIENAVFFPLYQGDQNEINAVLNDFLISGNMLRGCNAEDFVDNKIYDVNVADPANPVSITIPDDYFGPDEKSTESDWDATGQKGRYCNNQNTNYIFKNSKTNASTVCFDVFYDLEPSRDFLYFYDGQDLLVSLSGRGVHAVFKAPSGVRVNFASDYNGVYGGFHLTATPECNQPETTTYEKYFVHNLK